MELTRRSFLSAVGLGAAATLAGCAAGQSGGGSADGPAEGDISLLTPIFEGASGKQLLEGTLLKAFKKKYPKINVNVDYTTYNALNEKITTGLAGGLLADVIMVGVGWVPPFAYKKVFAELPAELAAQRQYEPRVLEPSKFDGKLYALPVVLDTRIVAYRKDFFAEAGITETPTNWADLRSVAKELTGGGRLGFDPFSIDLRQCWETFLFANGGELFDPTGREVKFNDDKGVEALQLFLDVIADRSADPALKTTTGQPTTLQQGRSAMLMTNNSLWVQLEKQNPDLIKDDKVGVFLVQNEVPAMLQGGTLAAQSARSKAPGAARALVEFLGSPDVILPAAEQRGSVVGDNTLRDSDYVKKNKFVQFAIENLSHARSEGGTPAWMEIREKIKPTLETAVVGQRSAREAIDDLAGACKEAISRL
jgi:multiple sugar transport system substrate-binding protein